MTIVFFAVAIIVIVLLTLLGLVIAGVIIVENWRPILYIAAAMLIMSLIVQACHSFSGS